MGWGLAVLRVRDENVFFFLMLVATLKGIK